MFSAALLSTYKYKRTLEYKVSCSQAARNFLTSNSNIHIKAFELKDLLHEKIPVNCLQTRNQTWKVFTHISPRLTGCTWYAHLNFETTRNFQIWLVVTDHMNFHVT